MEELGQGRAGFLIICTNFGAQRYQNKPKFSGFYLRNLSIVTMLAAQIKDGHTKILPSTS